MSYLRPHDYNLLIQPTQLAQITSSDATVQPAAEAWAQEEITSKLAQRYDMAQEFTDTTIFSNTATYKAENLVEINFPAYDTTKQYNIDDLVIYSGAGYICIAQTPSPAGVFDAIKWTLLGKQYDLYYVTLPKPLFDVSCFYKVGDQAFWKDKIYTCLIETVIIDHATEIQYPSIANVPLNNIFPDDPASGAQYWGTGTSYSITGIIPTDATKWTKGDNRSSQVVNYMVAMALYRIHMRISPVNIPKFRIDDYNQAISWLERVNQGIDSANIPELQPERGLPIYYGGQVKRINQW